MARPTKLTPDVSKKIVDAIRLGATYELAANYAGINYDTFNEWIKKGKSGRNKEFSEFSELVRKAEGDAAIGWLAKVEKAASDGDWHAATWKLERRYPRDYGKQLIEHSGKIEQEMTVNWPEDS